MIHLKIYYHISSTSKHRKFNHTSKKMFVCFFSSTSAFIWITHQYNIWQMSAEIDTLRTWRHTAKLNKSFHIINTSIIKYLFHPVMSIFNNSTFFCVTTMSGKCFQSEAHKYIPTTCLSHQKYTTKCIFNSLLKLSLSSLQQIHH